MTMTLAEMEARKAKLSPIVMELASSLERRGLDVSEAAEVALNLVCMIARACDIDEEMLITALRDNYLQSRAMDIAAQAPN